MKHFNQMVAAVVIVSFFFTASGVAAAQSASSEAGQVAPRATTTGDDSMASGLLDGEMLAEGHRTGGKLGVGLGIGVLSGVIGTGIGYFVIGPEPLSAEALQRNMGRGADYQLGLKTGWERKTRSKKRNAFLAGGLLGTAAFVAMFVAASGSE